ncbi:hypothetical protein OSB04_003626 [Centaurea solstitialis]|uniref:Uncharacterized protein n=1 Tax=Centaurea solstitialis TaxID=347529 RepID=A0AA38TV89_9ASTR|nr:hypothetical protein OSB04_003626 [Centaurea solstitialis]
MMVGDGGWRRGRGWRWWVAEMGDTGDTHTYLWLEKMVGVPGENGSPEWCSRRNVTGEDDRMARMTGYLFNKFSNTLNGRSTTGHPFSGDFSGHPVIFSVDIPATHFRRRPQPPSPATSTSFSGLAKFSEFSTFNNHHHHHYNTTTTAAAITTTVTPTPPPPPRPPPPS